MTATETKKPATVSLHDSALEHYHARQRGLEEERYQIRTVTENDIFSLLGRLMINRLGTGDFTRDDVTFVWDQTGEDPYFECMAIVTVDRLRFAAFALEGANPEIPHDDEHLRLIAPCVTCRENVMSEKNIQNLADLGELLHDWEPRCRNCSTESADPDECVQVTVHGNITERQLISAVRDLIREETRYV